MSPVIALSALSGSSVASPGSVPPWKLDELKDLSPGGICETGYGSGSKAQKTLQYVSNLKHREKYSSYLGWVSTVMPALLDALPEILFTDNGLAPLHDIPARAHAVLKKKVGNISAQQLVFLLSIIPLYHSGRALKNSIWKGGGLDPSGHTMFKMAQYGMLLSIATDHGKKTSISKPVFYYLAFTVIADALMLANTFTNCHTLSEVIVGGVLGLTILTIAHCLSKHTPLGHGAQKIANVATEIVARVGDAIGKTQKSSTNKMIA